MSDTPPDDVCRCDPPSCMFLATYPPMCPLCRKTLRGWRRPIVTAAPGATLTVSDAPAGAVDAAFPLPGVYRGEDS